MTDRKEPRRGLGRGLSALMADVDLVPRNDQSAATADRKLPIEQVEPNPDQPRRTFEDSDLEELTSSIRAKGILQPLIVRPKPQNQGLYQIVAGERRWRAAQAAKVHEVPVIIRDYTDTEMLEVAIVENIQRADLNPLDEAAGYRQLMDRFGHTQEKLAEALGKSRSHIANLLRLLSLPTPVQTMLVQGQLSSGHARALVTSDDPVALAQRVLNEGLTVRETETLVKGSKPKQTRQRQRKPAEKDADTRALEGDLSAALGLSVTIKHGAAGEGGEVVLRYKDLDQLDDICARLAGGF